MKKTLAVLLILTSAATSFATHAYRTETCLSASHKIEYTGNYAVGGMYKLTNLRTAGEVEIFEMEETAGEGNEFERIASKVISTKIKDAKCRKSGAIEFSEEISKTQTVINISQLSKEDEKTAGRIIGNLYDL